MSEEQSRAAMSQSASTEVLRPETVTWLAQLPRNVHPNALVQNFPRIANRIAELWGTPLRCEKYLDELLFDTRDNKRQGFPPEIAFQISYLKALISDIMERQIQALNPNYVNVWSDIV